jgi:hypothetical protein
MWRIIGFDTAGVGLEINTQINESGWDDMSFP